MKQIILFIFCLIMLPVQAFEDCILTTDGKLSDISIEHNDIIDVYPLFTIMNEKNTLFIEPLKEGKTRLCVLKNGKQKIIFNVEVTKEHTLINNVDGFEVLSIDEPPNDEFELDMPPELAK